MYRRVSRFGSYGIIIRDGKILLTQKKNGPYRGLWGLPGGAIEFEESPEDCLKREVLEETALLVENFELFCIATSNGRYFQRSEHVDFHHIGIVYSVKITEQASDQMAEEEVRWSDYTCLDLSELTPFAREAVSKLKGTCR
ncbi:MAG: NUDIX domain-containing protein [Waddliaceae bacterium]